MHTRQRIELLCFFVVARFVGIHKFLGGRYQLPGLILHIGGVFGNRLIVQFLVIRADLDTLALGYFEFFQPHQGSDHIFLAGRVVGSFF